MSLTPNDVNTAYQLLLGRVPSDAETQQTLENYATLADLRQAFVSSEEFRRKYEAAERRREAEQVPTLVHLHIPKTAGTSLAQALIRQPSLQPNHLAHDGETLEALRALPPRERRRLRYVHGHLSMGAGEVLGAPYRYVCLIRRPGPRMFSFYQFIARSQTHPAYETVRNMDFGGYLEFSVNAMSHRLELDNGQIRRLTGHTHIDSLGQEFALLREAVYNALTPRMILGFVEHMDLLLERLVTEGYLETPDIEKFNVSPAPEAYEAAVAALTPEQRQIFDSYIAWDTYLYDVLQTLLLSEH